MRIETMVILEILKKALENASVETFNLYQDSSMTAELKIDGKRYKLVLRHEKDCRDYHEEYC